jgi:cbb3-type cytochrome oxidase maturation protein
VEILFVLIPLSIVLVGIGVAAFIWAVRSGQFDTGEEAARLPDDDPTRRSP